MELGLILGLKPGKTWKTAEFRRFSRFFKVKFCIFAVFQAFPGFPGHLATLIIHSLNLDEMYSMALFWRELNKNCYLKVNTLILVYPLYWISDQYFPSKTVSYDHMKIMDNK